MRGGKAPVLQFKPFLLLKFRGADAPINIRVCHRLQRAGTGIVIRGYSDGGEKSPHCKRVQVSLGAHARAN
jgi:hypothetical protein